MHMSRTNIDLNDELVEQVMQRFGLRTKREAVNFALRRAAGSTATTQGLMSLRGISPKHPKPPDDAPMKWSARR
jgi:Arc/MetJ family transcription regulator